MCFSQVPVTTAARVNYHTSHTHTHTCCLGTDSTSKSPKNLPDLPDRPDLLEDLSHRKCHWDVAWPSIGMRIAPCRSTHGQAHAKGMHPGAEGSLKAPEIARTELPSRFQSTEFQPVAMRLVARPISPANLRGISRGLCLWSLKARGPFQLRKPMDNCHLLGSNIVTRTVPKFTDWTHLPDSTPMSQHRATGCTCSRGSPG